MIDCVNLETAHLFGNALPAQYRLRHRIFIERQHWALPSYHGMEYDQYDTPASHYLVWRDAGGEARGVARLNPTDRPYMLQEVFSHLVEGVELPHSANIWEGTRFGVERAIEPSLRYRIIAELLCGCLEFGLEMGVRQYFVLMPVVVLKGTFRRMGCSVELIGTPQRIGKDLVAAAMCAVSPEILKTVRSRTGVAYPVLRTAIDMEMEKAA